MDYTAEQIKNDNKNYHAWAHRFNFGYHHSIHFLYQLFWNKTDNGLLKLSIIGTKSWSLWILVSKLICETILHGINDILYLQEKEQFHYHKKQSTVKSSKHETFPFLNCLFIVSKKLDTHWIWSKKVQIMKVLGHTWEGQDKIYSFISNKILFLDCLKEKGILVALLLSQLCWSFVLGFLFVLMWHLSWWTFMKNKKISLKPQL